MEAEELIVSAIRDNFPGHTIVAEEKDQGKESPLHRWYVDPLDGTTNYTHGFPHFAVSIGVERDGDRTIGVIYDPLKDELFSARRGGGAFLNGSRISTSEERELGRALLATGFAYDRRTAADNNTARLDHFLRRSHGVRRAGAAVIDLSYVACGRLDGFWEKGLHPWDVAAASLIVQEAGGRVTDFDGGPDYLSGEFFLASNGRIHDEMLRVIRDRADAPRPAG